MESVGRAKGGTAGIPGIPTDVSQRGYDILAGAVVAYAEVDLGMVRPFVGVIFGTADGDPTDRQLHGFAPASWSGHYADHGDLVFCPPRDEYELCRAGLFVSGAVAGGTDGQPNAATGPLAIGTQVLGGNGGGFECNHSVTRTPLISGSGAHPTWGSLRPTPTRERS